MTKTSLIPPHGGTLVSRLVDPGGTAALAAEAASLPTITLSPTEACDLAMIAITPAGWYDWESKSVPEGSETLTGLQPVLEKAKASGMALAGMKAARHLSGLPVLGWWKKLDAFDEYYNEQLMAAPLSPFQRSYAYVLAHGLDVVNADIQDLAQLRENVAATATSPRPMQKTIIVEKTMRRTIGPP